MPFAYYQRLSSTQKAEYRKSARIGEVAIPRPRDFDRAIALLRRALEDDQRVAVEKVLQRICDELARRLRVPAVPVRVLGVRPALRGGEGELHGQYSWGDGDRQIEVWMRTAHHGRIVRFRTFLRTFIHEFGHHLDVERLGLPHTFHTEGFFQRESHLVNQLAPK